MWDKWTNAPVFIIISTRKEVWTIICFVCRITAFQRNGHDRTWEAAARWALESYTHSITSSSSSSLCSLLPLFLPSPPVLLFLSPHVPLFFHIFFLYFTIHPLMCPPLLPTSFPLLLFSLLLSVSDLSSSFSSFLSSFSSTSSSCCCCSPVWTEALFSPLSSSLDDRPFLEFRNPSHF